MRTLAVIIVALAVTGCSSAPKLLAEIYDQNDPCQTGSHVTRPENYQKPQWCGAARSRTVIYNRQNQPIGYLR